MMINSADPVRLFVRVIFCSIACLVIQLSPVALQERAFADVGLGEEQAAEKLELQKMKTEMNDIKSITNDAVEQLNKINTGAVNQDVREFHLICRETPVEIFPGARVRCLTYNGRLPGPLIKVKEGEPLRVVLHNQMQIPTSLHFHGMALPANVDSLPRREGGLVHPGETYTYQFVAPAPGLYWYQPQIPHAEQKTRGLYGPIVVEPKEQGESDKEFVILVSDLYAITSDTATSRRVSAQPINSNSHSLGGSNAQQEAPTPTKSLVAVSPYKFRVYGGDKHVYYLMNGQSAPAVPPMEVSKGQKVRLQLINAGQSAVPLHLSGHVFDAVGAGAETTIGHRDTVTVMPGSTYVVEFTADNPGVWSLASEVFEQATNEGRFPGGIACVLRYVDGSSK
jgi:FtsP/CotA-like multicopper oxidase with cupredoxin domain